MAKYNYPKYKVLISPDSKKMQGLRVGDVVRRQYFDSPHLVYSLMVVLEAGTDVVGGADSYYFIGALIEGDEPRTGELLDFVRVTNLFDEDRGGALYLTASDSEAPYMDVIDGLAKEFSLCYPTMCGGDPEVADRNKYSCRGGNLLDSLYKPSDGEVSRIYRLTRNATINHPAQNFGLKVSIEKPAENPQRVLVSFKARSSVGCEDVPVRFGYTNGAQDDYSDTISVSTEWQYYFLVFGVDYPAHYQRSFYMDMTTSLTTDRQWLEIGELNLVLQSDVSQFSKATKVRVGKIKGVVDPVFGVLEGYGAYFQNLYATRNVNIAGTLTAGDENGFASTFYVGKIHKNVILNSIDPVFIESAPNIVGERPPAGIGKVWQGGVITKIEVQSKEWISLHLGMTYCFSIWVKTDQKTIVSFYQNESHFKDNEISPEDGWRRYYGSFLVKDSLTQQMFVQVNSSSLGVVFSSPQLEAGTTPTQYQATDGTLSYVEDYGAWFNKGGIGGTIQNPLLRLNENGSISSRNGSFVINPDGTGHFASGRFRWTKDTIVLQEVTIKWEDLDEETRDQLKTKSVSLSGSNVFHYPDVLGQATCEPEEINLFAMETNFSASSRKWYYQNQGLTWSEIANGSKDFLNILPDGHYWEGRDVLFIKHVATHKEQEYEAVFTVFKQYDGSDAYSIYIHSDNGLVFRNSIIATTLSAQVMKGSEDVTDMIPDTCFRWYRTSRDREADEIWNNTVRMGRSLEITHDDVASKAVFDCEVTLSTI